MASTVIKNWDNKTWLSSNDYIKSFNKFLLRNTKLNSNSKILDIGCAKGFLLDEFGKLLKKPTLCGLDISHYAITKAKKKIKKNLCVGNATSLPFDNNYFDLVISINSLHNIMGLNELKSSFKEIKRVSKKNVYITLGAYTSKKGEKILDKWAVVATAYMSTRAWLKFFNHIGYKGDYWWFKPE